MRITPDSIVIFTWHGIHFNATILFTWIVMAILTFGSLIVTRGISSQKPTRIQSVLEAVITVIRNEIRNVTHHEPDIFLPYLGTLFLFISLSNLLAAVPLYHPPTGSLSTTAALACCAFAAGPWYGIRHKGLIGYLKTFSRPSVLLIPFNVTGELTRVLSMSVRLFGNVLSGTMVGAILISLVPLFVPVAMSALELLIGQIQAYIFTILAAIFIASATQAAHDGTAADL